MARKKAKSEALVQFDPRATNKSITIAARNALGHFTKAQGVVLRANRRSVEYLTVEASKNLSNSITAHGRPQDRNSGRLKRAIEDPANHSATFDGFSFMVDDRVRPEVPYYRAIERGSTYWVGKRLPFLFLQGGGEISANSSPSARRDPVNSRGRRNDHLVGPREFRRFAYGGDRTEVTIRNPVPRYGYAAKARRAFLRNDIYAKYILEEAKQFERETGATITIS